MPSAADVTVAVTGGVFYAPDATAMPTNAVDDLDAAFDEVGYISEDGITQSIGSETTSIRAWQNSDEVRVVRTSHTLTYAWTMIETNPESLTLYYGNHTAGVTEITAAQGFRGEFVIEYHDGDRDVRIVLPDAQVTELGDTQLVNGQPVGYPVTVTAFPDDTGVKAYLYLDDTTSS
jgi:hypothetical protein